MAATSRQSSTVIDAPIQVVFEHAADFESLPSWQPDVKVVRCLERGPTGRAAVVYTELDTLVRTAKATLNISYDEFEHVGWVMSEGNVPTFEGHWHLTRLGRRRTKVEYELMIDFGRFGRLVRGPASRALEGAVVSSMPGRLKTHIESI